jgi:hypothetical protein
MKYAILLAAILATSASAQVKDYTGSTTEGPYTVQGSTAFFNQDGHAVGFYVSTDRQGVKAHAIVVVRGCKDFFGSTTTLWDKWPSTENIWSIKGNRVIDYTAINICAGAMHNYQAGKKFNY